MSSAAMPVAVVGGGVCGLATALQLADKLPHLDITVISDRPVEETTSFGAGGMSDPQAHAARRSPLSQGRALPAMVR